MKNIKSKFLIVVTLLLPVLFQSCENDESMLLSEIFYGEEGKGIVVLGYSVIWDYAEASSVSTAGNYLINRGERVYINLKLKNTSESKVEKVTVKISTQNSYITGVYPLSEINYGNILKAEEVICNSNSLTQNSKYYSCYFSVSKLLPVNEVVVFDVEIYSDGKLINIVDFSPNIN